MDDQSDDSNTREEESADPVFTEEDDGGFDHPDDDEIETIPSVESADEAVDGDEARKDRLQSKADELRQKADELEDAEGDVDADTPVSVDEEVDPYQNLDERADGGTEATDGNATDDGIDQAGSSVFDADEAEAVNEEFADDFDLKPVEDIPDDFDFEAQDTQDFGVADDHMVIEHNGTYFELTHPEGVREDKFWGAMQTARSRGPVAVFDVMIEYIVSRPEDIKERMERENWTGFAKAGLATKCMSFVGMDELQDF